MFTEAQKKEMKEWIKTIIGAILIYLFLSIFFLSIKVDGRSMLPTFQHGDFLMATRNYLHSDYELGDVIIFNDDNLGKALIKRVIGVPGDEVKIEAGEVYVNGQKLWEPYINNPPLETLQVTVPEGQYFVMGDNRQDSLDSRFELVGFIPKSDILGKAFVEFFNNPHIIK